MKRSKHSLSHYRLATMDQGELVPIGITEVLPGDSIQQKTSLLVRASPLNAPIMHPINVSVHHWFVPTRLLWDDFENFITGGPDGEDDSEYPTITFPQNGPEIGTLADYLGIPTDLNVVGGLEVSALPFRAYALIFNEWYRDQDLVPELTIDTTSGPDTTTSVALQKSAWEKDYFTTARPWPQKGPDVVIPIGTTAPVIPTTAALPQMTNSVDAPFNLQGSAGSNAAFKTGGNATSAAAWKWTTTTGLQVDLSTATGVSINVLREGFALQNFQEHRSRFGSRYSEYLRFFGITPSDARLQRPEYLGGGRQLLQISEVLQTSADGGGLGVGDLAGHGIGAMSSNRYRRFFEEHGYIITLMRVLPKTVYMDGLNRSWLRRSKEDYWQKEFQHMGSQEVYNAEIFAASPTPFGVFGYQDRYDEYRFAQSGVSGEFRTTLDYWHMARSFPSTPTLNGSFVTATPTKDVYQSTATDGIYVQAYHSIQARRLLSQTGSSSNL